MGTRYDQISVEERRRIERWRAARVSPTEMARVLGRHRSTIFRELQRNHFVDRSMPKVVGYFAMAAQLQTADRRARVQRHSELARGRHGELAHPQGATVVVSSAAAGFCRSPLRRFSRSR